MRRAVVGLGWLLTIGSSLGCLGTMMVEAPRPAECGIAEEPPMRIVADMDRSGTMNLTIVGWDGLSLTGVTVSGGEAAVGALPASAVRVDVVPAPGVTFLLMLVSATCPDGATDQRWFQLDIGEGGTVTTTAILGISG